MILILKREATVYGAMKPSLPRLKVYGPFQNEKAIIVIKLYNYLEVRAYITYTVAVMDCYFK